MKEVLTSELRWVIYNNGYRLEQKKINKSGDSEWVAIPTVKIDKHVDQINIKEQ